ncbi:MAG: hypothetical protein ACLPX5_04995 [Dissulfurispiraceae bacterium]
MTRLGFLDVHFEDSIVRGGILVTDAMSVPLEVRWSKPVEPTRWQRIVYGNTLKNYLAIHCFAIPLLNNLQNTPDLILICRDYLLDLRPHISSAVILINKADHTKKDDGSSEPASIDSNAQLGLLFSAHKRFQVDLVHVPQLQSIFSSFDPTEVFSRILIFLQAQVK